MTAQDINESLYRPIFNGSQFDDLMPQPDYKTVRLATGNTKVAINEMAKWAKKYAHQTQELAPELIGDTLQQTLNNIQWFLYWHINYSIDGTDQNLKSPAYAWATRQEGTDCKSYTIFASTILLNLGIEHYLRRIKQEVDSDAFTHVYVVIPKNQTTGKLPSNAQFNKDYFIIDGTIQYNNEIPFLEKDDIYMETKLPIYGMAAPNYGLGCADDLDCGCDNATMTPNFTVAGLNAPDLEQEALQNAILKFNQLLDYLEDNGVPQEVTDNAMNNLQKFIDAGVEPTVAQVLGVEYINGLGFSETDATSLVQTGITAGADAFLPGSGMIISALIPKDFLNNTFGAVFANGFNLSCWNSTFTPAKVTAEVQKIHVPYFTNVLALASNSKSTLELEKNFNLLLKAVDISYDMYAVKMWNGANWRSCSKEAIQIYVDIVTGAKVQTDILLKQLQDKYSISITTATVPAEFTYQQAYTGQPDFKWSEKQHGNSTYRIIKFNERIEDSLPQISDSYVDENGNLVEGDGTPPKPQQAGMGVGSMVLLAGLLAGGIYYASQQKKKN